MQGTIYLKNADILSMVHETRPHVIRIKPEGRKGYEYIDCERAADQTTWLQCLMRATAIHDAHISRSKEVMRFASLLGIDPSVKLSQRVVARAYRKMCLKVVPERHLMAVLRVADLVSVLGSSGQRWRRASLQ